MFYIGINFTSVESKVEVVKSDESNESPTLKFLCRITHDDNYIGTGLFVSENQVVSSATYLFHKHRLKMSSSWTIRNKDKIKVIVGNGKYSPNSQITEYTYTVDKIFIIKNYIPPSLVFDMSVILVVSYYVENIIVLFVYFITLGIVKFQINYFFIKGTKQSFFKNFYILFSLSHKGVKASIETLFCVVFIYIM